MRDGVKKVMSAGAVALMAAAAGGVLTAGTANAAVMDFTLRAGLSAQLDVADSPIIPTIEQAALENVIRSGFLDGKSDLIITGHYDTDAVSTHPLDFVFGQPITLAQSVNAAIDTVTFSKFGSTIIGSSLVITLTDKGSLSFSSMPQTLSLPGSTSLAGSVVFANSSLWLTNTTSEVSFLDGFKMVDLYGGLKAGSSMVEIPYFNFDPYSAGQIIRQEADYLLYQTKNGLLSADGNGIASFKVSAASLPAAVPEPSTWAMIICGFGLIGATMRRRQRVSVPFA